MSSNTPTPLPTLLTYPYSPAPDGLFYPILQVKFFYKRKEHKSFALIDSGASTSLIRPDLAKTLGIKIESGKAIYLSGVGGHINGF